MLEEDLYQTTMRSFQNKLQGKRKLQEAQHKDHWERHREIIVTISRPNLNKTHINKDAKDIYRLPWDVKLSKGKKVKQEKVNNAFDYLDQRNKD